MKEKKKSIVRSIRVEGSMYNRLLGEVEKSGKNFNEYVLDKIFNSKEVVREVIVEKLVEVPMQETSVVISPIIKSGKVYKLGKELPREFKDGLYRVSMDFVVGDEVYIAKV